MRAWCVLGVLSLAGVSSAQPVDPAAGAPGDASAAFEAGRKLLAQRRAAEACVEFARAIDLEPGNVGVMLNLGLCNEQLDKQATALTWFRRALARATERQLAESVRAASDKIAALSRTVPTLRITLSPPGAAAAVTVDGSAVAGRELSRVEIDAGHHVVTAAAGGAAVREEVDAVDGAAVPIGLVLPQPRAPVARAVAAPRASDPGSARWRVYAVGAAGAGLVVGSVALALVGRSAAHGSEHPDVQRRWQATVRYGGTSMFVVGGAALAWAIASYVRAPDERAVQAARTILAPVVGDRGVGIGVRGAF